MQAVPFLIITHYNVFRIYINVFSFYCLNFSLSQRFCTWHSVRGIKLSVFLSPIQDMVLIVFALPGSWSVYIRCILSYRKSRQLPGLLCKKACGTEKNRIHPPIPWTSPGKSLPMSVPLCRPRQTPGPAFCTLFRIHVMPGSKAWSTCPLSSPPFFHYDHTAFFLVFFQTFPLQVTFIRLIDNV